MVNILAESDFTAIRRALGTDVDETTLPPYIIREPIYLFAAEAQVKARVVDWQDRLTAGGDDAQHLRNAAIYYTAALLVPVLPRLKSEQSSQGQNYTRDLISWSDMAAELQSRGDGELDYVLAPASLSPERPTMFAVAVGRRGR